MDTRRLVATTLGMAMLAATAPGLTLAQDDPAGSLTPDGVEWTLTTIAGGAVPDGVEVTLFMSGGEIVGNAGCNSYFGSYEIDGAALTFPNPFGVTQKLCEGLAQEVEDAYLPLLQATAGWAIDEDGALSLSDADGAVGLVYGEAPIDVTASDVDALMATLGDLQTQIDEASAEVAALAETTESIPLTRFERRLRSVEQSVSQVEERMADVDPVNLRRRVVALEEAVVRLDRTIDRFRDRIMALERASREHEGRIAALEEAEPEPVP